jgi:hypothetical protein
VIVWSFIPSRARIRIEVQSAVDGGERGRHRPLGQILVVLVVGFSPGKGGVALPSFEEGDTGEGHVMAWREERS